MTKSALRKRQIDDAIDAFERRWSADTSLIEQVAAEFELIEEHETLVELIRSDIDRHYSAGLEVNLTSYFDRFSFLSLRPELAGLVCFEDFRARRSRGYACSSDRWSEIRGIQDQDWFRSFFGDQETSSHDSRTPNRRAESFEASVASDESLGADADVASREPFPEVGERCGGFELLALLGVGAFSRVYLAQQMSLGRRYVAVKIVDRPFREPWHLARLSHTGIVPLFSCHRVGNLWLLCMPYSGSATLADWLKRDGNPGLRSGQSLIATIRAAQRQLTVRETSLESEDGSLRTETVKPVATDRLQKWHESAAQPLERLKDLDPSGLGLWFFRRLASAIAHAHQRGIVHGDLKPANVLVCNDGEPALIDFNLSQECESAKAMWAGGTLPYMAREQLADLLKRNSGSIQTQSDVFAVGVIMFELIEGRPPFVGPLSSADAELADAIRLREQLPAFRRGTTASFGLQSIILKCLHPDAAERYPSGVELLEDIEFEYTLKPLRYARESFMKSRVPKLVAGYSRAIWGIVLSLIFGSLALILFLSVSQSHRQSERLSAIQSFEQFTQLSDAVFVSCLTGEGVADSSRLEQLSSLIQQSLSEVGLEPQNELRAWQKSHPIAHWTDNERQIAEDRVLAIAVLGVYEAASHERRMPSASAQELADQLNKAIERLPDSIKNSRSALAIKALANGLQQGEADTTGAQRTQSVSPLPSRPADQVLTAVGLLTSGQWDRCLTVLDSTPVPESLRLVYWLTRGRAQVEKGLTREAIASYSMAMKDIPESPKAYLNRGLAYLRVGELKQAERDFSEAISKDPRFVAGWTNRYFVRSALQDPVRALEDLDRAIQLEPKSNRLRLIRARALRQAGRLKDAKSDFDLAMKHLPATAEDWVSVALARLPQHPEQAVLDLQKAETLHGASEMILQSLAHVQSEHLHQPQAAVETLSRLLELYPRFQKALAGRAVLYARNGQIELAEKDVEALQRTEGETTAESVYQIACVYALCSVDRPEFRTLALQNLARAVRRGYGGQLLEDDSDLIAVRGTSEFNSILQSYRLAGDP